MPPHGIFTVLLNIKKGKYQEQKVETACVRHVDP